jgi:hypothetical protein
LTAAAPGRSAQTPFPTPSQLGLSAATRSCCLAFLAALLLCGLAASPAAATEYKRSPRYSLTGSCEQPTGLDPIPDPGCPYLPPPAGPTARFNEPRSVAIDAYGNEYVASYANGTSAGRIDVFDEEGEFITELADPHGPKSVAIDSKGNLYVWEKVARIPSEIVRYTPTVYDGKAGNIAYDIESRFVVTTEDATPNGGVAVNNANDQLFVARGFSISVYKSKDEDPNNSLIETLSGPNIAWTNWAAIDAQRGRLYASFCANPPFECGVVVMDLAAPHAVIEEIMGPGPGGPYEDFLSPQGWLSLAVDETSGHFFVGDLGESKNIFEFDHEFKYVRTLTEKNAFEGGNALQIAIANSPMDPTIETHRYLYVPALSSKGTAWAFEPLEKFPCALEAASVENVGETEAEASATVDPRGAECEYVLEVEVAGSGQPQLIGTGKLASNSQPTEVNAVASGLEPGTEYTLRVSVENELGGAEEEVSFTTYSDAPVSSSCPNQDLRVGAAAKLPDCRAYELVTPPDTNGHPPRGVGTPANFSAPQASPSGEALSFIIEGGPLPGFEGTGSFDGDPYLTTRDPLAGWTTTAAGPNGTESDGIHPGSTSADQRYSFWGAGELGSKVVAPGENNYVNYPDGHSELVAIGTAGTDPRARGMFITENGTHIVLQTVNLGSLKAKPLEPNSPPEGTTAVYDRTPDGVTHVVSLLPPDDKTPEAGQNADYLGASPDGEGIAFRIGTTTLYLRLHNAESFQIGTGVKFAGVSEGGERVFYVEGGDLKAFDTGSESVVEFTETGDAIPVNVANDGSRAYFLSKAVIAAAGANPNGALPQAGQQNLYLSEEGLNYRFVGTVTERDVEGDETPTKIRFDGLGLWLALLEARQPSRAPSRLDTDGSVILFQSRANLDGYDPDGAPQVYRYDSAATSLECISCLPSGLPASGGASLQSYALRDASPIPFRSSAFVPAITPDGNRAFFESTEALVASDTDGVQDVYEWEADGVGSCNRPQGCVYLISSGASARDNYLYGHSADGDDVFFTTSDVLLGRDTGGTISIYDARVGGGFAQPAERLCDGEGCKPAASAPPSVAFPAERGVGEGNFTPDRSKRCPKGKSKLKKAGKVRCVKKKKHTKRPRRPAGTSRENTRCPPGSPRSPSCSSSRASSPPAPPLRSAKSTNTPSSRSRPRSRATRPAPTPTSPSTSDSPKRKTSPTPTPRNCGSRPRRG